MMLVLPILWTLTTLSPQPQAQPFHSSIEITIPALTQTTSTTENYLPRRLYPGTYKNFCGPTPETSIKDGCTAHGWHGDDALDKVDEACRLHDISYCACETQLLSRKHSNEEIAGLSSLVALRFLTLPTLTKTVDQEYLDCIHKADTNLIATGVRVRGEQQRSNCATEPSWFCQATGYTLGTFEKVNLDIFLRDLDADDPNPRERDSLTTLERQRHNDLMNQLKNGKTIAEASSSQLVQDDEMRLLERLIDNSDR